MIRRLRLYVGLVLWLLAVRWAVIAWLRRSRRSRRALQREPTYPNEWGVRTLPLSVDETRAALVRERLAFLARGGYALDPDVREWMVHP